MILQYITMTFGDNIKFVLAITVFSFAAYAVGEAMLRESEYKEEIKELYSRLKCCEEKNSETENHELKK